MNREKSSDLAALIKNLGLTAENTATLRKMMKISLVILPFFFIMICAGYYNLPEGSLSLKMFGYIFFIAVTGVSFFWCLADSVVNDYPFGKYLPLAFLFFIPLGITIYLYRSRGVKNGSIALAKVAAFVAVMFFLSAICVAVTGYIFKIPLKNVSNQTEPPTVTSRVTTHCYRS